MRRAAKDIIAVAETFSDRDWQTPSAASEWSVQDVVTHVGCLLGDLVAAVNHHPLPDLGIEKLNDIQVAEQRDHTGAETITSLRQRLDQALAAFEPLQDEPAASAETQMLDLGSYPLHAIADMFAFDMTTHLRYDILAPRGPIDRDVPALDEVLLEPSIAWLVAGVTKMQPALIASIGGPLRLELTGPAARDLVIGVIDGAITVSPTTDACADVVATIRSSTADFLAWSTRRVNWRNAVSVAGDHVAAQRFLNTVNLI
jgi:uncharacterized protein (TIGR03083 family)